MPAADYGRIVGIAHDAVDASASPQQLITVAQTVRRKDELLFGKPLVGLRKAFFYCNGQTRQIMCAHAVVGMLHGRDEAALV